MVCYGCKAPVARGSRYTYPCVIRGMSVLLCVMLHQVKRKRTMPLKLA